MDPSGLSSIFGLAAVASSLVPFAARLLTDRFSKQLSAEADPLGRDRDALEREEFVQMVADTAAGNVDGSPEAASVLERFRARSERQEKMLTKEIQSNLRLRNIYQWVFLASIVLGLIPLVLGVWLIILGTVPAGAVTTAVGVMVEISGLFANRASENANRTAEARIAELRESQSGNDDYELALYAASLIEVESIRAALLRDLALNQVGMTPKAPPSSAPEPTNEGR